MKHSASIGASALAVATAHENLEDTSATTLAGVCPACNSVGFESVLSAGNDGPSRTLIACSRCRLLRFLGSPAATRSRTFADSIHFSSPCCSLVDRIRRFFSKQALHSKLSFVLDALAHEGSEGYVLDCDGGDGSAGRAMENAHARPLVLARDPLDAIQALHRQGVYVVAAHPAEPPVAIPMFDAVSRLRGFAHEGDPVFWLHSAGALLRPGGRLVIQAFDSASWAFLICGSQWTGLEPASATYAFRAVDLEVMLDYSGYRISRRSHFFPLLNASVWISSLFPNLDPETRRGRPAPAPGFRSIVMDLGYFLLVVAALPLSIVESVCHAGSVLMLEAERK